ncbi:hypothetical protein A4X06_0g546 [Tilletia controversa]|uniref:Uncharacterized protein n=1 Tax=Tilletia controversa TaxID=13291 RepID=A0A8X7N0B7_9BASI|nr:hypothetical protein CF328_g504 [Tilletia controversa]KAE8255212.1 hypothetical protein A4X06_0g546 [Tilletia controversa]
MADSIASGDGATKLGLHTIRAVNADAPPSGGDAGAQQQTTPMEEVRSTESATAPVVAGKEDVTRNTALGVPLSGPQHMDVSSGSSAASQMSEAVPMSTDNTPPESQVVNSVPSIQPPPDASSKVTPKEASLAATAVLQQRLPPSSSASHTVRSGRSHIGAPGASSQALSSSPDGSARDNQTSPTLTNRSTPQSNTSPVLGMTRIDQSGSHSHHHQSHDTQSAAATPASNSDDGTVHTSETSSGKSKALSDDGGTGSLIQKLPLNVVDRIFLYVRMHACRHILPASIREDIMIVPNNLRVMLWVAHAWGMNWLFPIRTVCSNFSQAARRNPLWEEYIIAVHAARRERADRRGIPAFWMALQYQRELCFACCLNGTSFDARTHLNPQFVANMGRFVPLCDVHEAALSAPDETPMLCSNCLLDERRYLYARTQDGRDNYILRDDVDISYVEDDERFPQAESVCSSCRSEAFFTAIITEDVQFRRYVPQLRRTLAFNSYVWQGEGTATDAAKSAIEQLWLETATDYSQMIKHAQLQKRRDRLRKTEAERALRRQQRQQRELLKSLVPGDGTDSASELSNDEDYTSDQSIHSIHYEDEDADGNIYLTPTEDRWLRDRAWHDWCRRRLDLGLWKSAHDQQDAELPRAPGLPHLPQIVTRGMATKPTLEPVSTEPIVMDVPLLPPVTLFHKASRIWDEIALPEFFKLPMANIVDMLKTREDGFELSLEMDFAHLFRWLRDPQAWVMSPQQHAHGGSGSNTTTLVSRFSQPPFVPNSPVDVGAGTVARIMELWKRACAPLGECDCGICRRQKRKRSHDESNAGNGGGGGGGGGNNEGPKVSTQNNAVQPAPQGGGGNGSEHEGQEAAQMQQEQQAQQQQQRQQEQDDEAEGPRKHARFEATTESS